MTEDQIREEVLKHLQSKVPNVFGKTRWLKEYTIQFGSNSGRADLALQLNGRLFVIVECKSLGVVSHGKEQLESYLNASRANLGIFANHRDPKKWRYYDNSIGFDEIDRPTFWEKIKAAFETERGTEHYIETQAQQQKQQRIEARAKKLVNANPEVIQKRANKIIDELAKTRVNEKAIRDAVAWQLQQKIKQLESQLQEKTNQLESKINNLQTALDESRNGAMWGWILFGISVVLLIAVAANS